MVSISLWGRSGGGGGGEGGALFTYYGFWFIRMFAKKNHFELSSRQSTLGAIPTILMMAFTDKR